jgi:hypothetical protein
MRQPSPPRFPLLHRSLLLTACVGALGSLASAQLNDEWLGFVKENHRLVSDPSLGLGDTEEKDYYVGDLNNDGWDDMVVVRKQPWTSAGRRPNVLFMNEGGVLVDRTALYASASTVPGDQGFLTPTNDRDVVFADVDGDGWLDVITATTISDGLPKHISHPRVYMNLGNAPNGNWLGLQYQEHRIPQLMVNGQPCPPRFCGVAAGDLTGNGFPDLFFADYDFGGTCDLNDRLLINDGTGVFTDQTSTRMTASWLQSTFGTSAEIADMNGNGVNDVIKNSGLGGTTSIIYNNPLNPGFFNLNQNFYTGAGYHVTVGDLNRDGRLDAVVGDDAADRFLLNQGNDSFGRVTWGPAQTFQFAAGSDDGFPGNTIIADLNNDGWPGVLIADVDVDISGCNRRLNIYHNRGGTVGGSIVLREEAGSSGWRGAVGLMPADLTGTHDVAVIDINRDGYLDLVIGRCTGTAVWINTLGATVGQAFCFCTGSGTAAPCGNTSTAGRGCRNSSGLGAILAGAGSASVTANDLTLTAAGLLPNQPALLFAGNNAVNGGNGTHFGDGLRCAGGGLARLGIRFPNAQGVASWGPNLGALGGWSAGQTRRLQGWYRDPQNSPCGNPFNLTNGYEVTFTP